MHMHAPARLRRDIVVQPRAAPIAGGELAPRQQRPRRHRLRQAPAPLPARCALRRLPAAARWGWPLSISAAACSLSAASGPSSCIPLCPPALALDSPTGSSQTAVRGASAASPSSAQQRQSAPTCWRVARRPSTLALGSTSASTASAPPCGIQETGA